ncbi:MAG TPA: T9SS type A sorting domain-containing protein, partial [Chitinophagaceae bacterium]|nr:T9SS type A sorting domain-containing protein [Chitinophagaceae bacterium]
QADSATTSANGTSNTGGNGTSASGDGGGGGGGGGGQYGSIGGGVHAAGGETAGNGGFLGGNSVSGASSVTTNGNIAWTTTGQIEITFTSTLPVTWLSFTATKQNSSVTLNWSTATEQNTMDYEVQHSINGSDWSNIGVVTAAGNSNTTRQYGFVDQNPVIGSNYYRLLQLDADGRINYSKVIVFNFQAAGYQLKIYPNPVLNGVVTVNLKQAYKLEVYNNIGAKMMEREFSAGEHLFNVSLLSKGTYFMKAKDEVVLFVIQ